MFFSSPLLSKVEENDFVDAGMLLEYRRCTVCQKAFANEAIALMRHAATHATPKGLPKIV